MAFEALEDRCVYSASPLAATGVLETVTWEPGPTSSYAAFQYTGAVLVVPTAQTALRTARVSVAGSAALDAVYVDRGNGLTAVAADPILSVPGTYAVVVTLAGPGADDFVYQLRLTTAFTVSAEVKVRTTIVAQSSFDGLLNLGTVPAPPPAVVPPVPGDGQTIPPPPPAVTTPPGPDGNSVPPTPAPPVPPPFSGGGTGTPAPVPPQPAAPRPLVAPLPTAQYAEFRAGWSQVSFTTAATITPVADPGAMLRTNAATPASTYPARIGVSLDPPPAAALPDRKRPVELELVAARDVQVLRPVDDGLPVFLAVAVDSPPLVPPRGPDATAVLVRLAAQPTIEATTADGTAAAGEEPAAEPGPARAAALYAAGLIGLGSGRHYFGRRAAALRRAFFPAA